MLLKIAFILFVFATVFSLLKGLYPGIENIFKAWEKKKVKRLTPRIDQIFLDIPFKKLVIIDTLSPLLSGLTGYLLTRNILMALACAAVGLIIPIMIIKQLERQRRQKFALQLVDGLLIFSSSLKAGLSLLQAFETLTEEMPPPMSQEFGLVVSQMRMGTPLEETLVSLKKRFELEELDLTVTAILVARETGGDLTSILSRIINTIQEKNKLIHRVNALCIQAKLQGMIMSVLPILFGLFVYKSNPQFFEVFLKDSLGRNLLMGAVFLEILGMFFIRKLSKISL